MMSDIMAGAMTWLESKVNEMMSQSVTYRRSQFSCTLDAAIGSQLLRVTDKANNVRVERTQADFVFLAADLILDGDNVTPMDGDRIEFTTGGVTYEYEVMPIFSEPSWRYTTPYKSEIRVHTKGRGVA